MITMALLGKIRAMHRRDGKSISEIARLTSLSRNTIKKWLKASAPAAPKYRRREVATKLRPFVERLEQALKADAAHFSDRGRRFQRDRGRCFRVIVDDHGSTRVKGFIVPYWRSVQACPRRRASLATNDRRGGQAVFDAAAVA